MKLVLVVALAMQAVALALCAVRALRGPTVPDRVVAVDAAAVVLIGIVITSSMLLRETKYLDYALVLAIFSFVSTVGFARYLERGVLIERDTD